MRSKSGCATRNTSAAFGATTIREYRSSAYKHLVPAFGDRKLEALTTQSIEAWKSQLLAEGKLSRRTISKLLTNLNGIFKRAWRVWGLQANPVEGVERLPDRYDPGNTISTRPRRSGRSYVRLSLNRTPRSSSSLLSQACGWGRC